MWWYQRFSADQDRLTGTVRVRAVLRSSCREPFKLHPNELHWLQRKRDSYLISAVELRLFRLLASTYNKSLGKMWARFVLHRITAASWLSLRSELIATGQSPSQRSSHDVLEHPAAASECLFEAQLFTARARLLPPVTKMTRRAEEIQIWAKVGSCDATFCMLA